MYAICHRRTHQEYEVDKKQLRMNRKFAMKNEIRNKM